MAKTEKKVFYFHYRDDLNTYYPCVLERFMEHVADTVPLTYQQSNILRQKLFDKLETLIIRDHDPRAVTLAIQKPRVGFAICSKQDNFCRRIGRQIALSRLLNKPVWLK